MKIAPTNAGHLQQAEQAASQTVLKPVRSAEQASKAQAQRHASEARKAERAEKADTPSEATERAMERLQEQAGQALSRFGHAVRLQARDGRVVMQVVDKQSGELVNQFPNEDTLALAERLDEMRGILFSSEG